MWYRYLLPFGMQRRCPRMHTMFEKSTVVPIVRKAFSRSLSLSSCPGEAPSTIKKYAMPYTPMYTKRALRLLNATRILLCLHSLSPCSSTALPHPRPSSAQTVQDTDGQCAAPCWRRRRSFSPSVEEMIWVSSCRWGKQRVISMYEEKS